MVILVLRAAVPVLALVKLVLKVLGFNVNENVDGSKSAVSLTAYRSALHCEFVHEHTFDIKPGQ